MAGQVKAKVVMQIVSVLTGRDNDFPGVVPRMAEMASPFLWVYVRCLDPACTDSSLKVGAFIAALLLFGLSHVSWDCVLGLCL